MIAEDSNRFVPFVTFYFKLYFAFSITFQSILLFLIITKSPAALSNLRYFLINTATLQIIHASLAFFSQQRVLPNAHSTAILHDGPCRLWGPNVCFTAYHFFLGVTLGSGLGIASTVVFRHRTLRIGDFGQSRVFGLIFLSYIPLVVTIVLPFTVPWNFEVVREATYLDHPTYDLSVYEPFDGFADHTTFQFIFVTSLVIFCGIIPNTSSTAILHYGPCRAFGPNICFISHHLVLAIALGSALGVASTVIFRHRTLRMGTFNRQRVMVILILSYIPAIIMIILPFTVPWDFATVRAATYSEHPTYNLSIYEPFGGFADHNNFQFIFNTGLVVVASYTLPCVTGILTKRIITMVNRNTVMSSKTKKQSKSLAYGLALQNILPCISYIPPATAWVISQFGEVEVLYNEHLLTIFISFPSLMDPLLSFYFIVPFRNAIYGFFTCKKTAKETITVSNASGRVLMAKRSIRMNNN